MKVRHRHIRGSIALAGVLFAIHPLATQAQEMCGGTIYSLPYTDVSGVGAAFCPGIMEAYVTGVSKGTTPTTFSPNETVTRVQMTTFLQRSLDQGVTRASRRAALEQWSTSQNIDSMQTISVGGTPTACAADGENIWVTTSGDVVQVEASTGNVLASIFTSYTFGVVVAAGKLFVTGYFSDGLLYVIQGSDFVIDYGFASYPKGVTFDGANVWSANASGSVSIFTPPFPDNVTTVSTGFNAPWGIIYDGSNIWVTDAGAGTLLKLNSGGGIIQTVQVGAGPAFPVFDGTNIWVPNMGDNSITVVQASTGKVVATIASDASNQLNGPEKASFDGERILVTNNTGDTVTLFKAADLSLIANVSTGAGSAPSIACSDGINFWVPLAGTGNLLRF